MPTKKVTDDNFDTEVMKSQKPTIVDFWAEWCGPCKQIGPILEEISDEMSNEVLLQSIILMKNLIHPPSLA